MYVLLTLAEQMAARQALRAYHGEHAPVRAARIGVISDPNVTVRGRPLIEAVWLEGGRCIVAGIGYGHAGRNEFGQQVVYFTHAPAGELATACVLAGGFPVDRPPYAFGRWPSIEDILDIMDEEKEQ